MLADLLLRLANVQHLGSQAAPAVELVPTTNGWVGSIGEGAAVGRDNVAVEHLVALADAWAYGADQWDETQRVAFANGLATMTVVSMETSQARAEADAAGWLPADDAAACRWGKAQVQVKTAYDLAVDAGERKSLERALTGC